MTDLYEKFKNEQCPVCGYYCAGKGGIGCIDKPALCGLQGTQDKSKSPSPCRHTLEDGADTTTELVSGKSSGFIGGMRQEKTNLSDERIDTKQEEKFDKICFYCVNFSKEGATHEYEGFCSHWQGWFDQRSQCEFYYCEQTQGHKRIS